MSKFSIEYDLTAMEFTLVTCAGRAETLKLLEDGTTQIVLGSGGHVSTTTEIQLLYDALFNAAMLDMLDAAGRLYKRKQLALLEKGE